MLALTLLLLATSGTAAPAATPSPEVMLAADAAVYAPPDLKHQLVRNRARLMQGVADAVAAESGKRDAAGHKAAATRVAREIAKRIRSHARFADVAYEVGGLVHECAAMEGVPAAPPTSALFAGYTADPFRDPDTLFAVREGTPRWDAALTRATRLLAFVWKAAGGDASIALRMPVTKGPWPVRE